MGKQVLKKISNSEVEVHDEKLVFWLNEECLIFIKGEAGSLYATFEGNKENDQENFIIFDWVIDERCNAPDYYDHLSNAEKIILAIDDALEQKELKKFHGLFKKYLTN